MASKAELESIIARQTGALKAQMAEIEGLRAENQRLNDCIATNHDALFVLQELYSNRRNPPSVIMRAAGEAIGFERAKPPSVAINAGVSLYDVLERKRLERFQAKPAVIDAKPPAASAN